MTKRKRQEDRRVSRGEGWEVIRRPTVERGPKVRRQSEPPAKQRIKVRTEGRGGGKVVTIAQGFRLTPKDLKALAKKLKQTIGVGGKAGEEHIELQGRHVEKVVAALEKAGYPIQ